ncbi:MAG: HD domain-containing protein [Acidimicrobiia bacterium]|nr:HD domain-containing protein [Acidimicrobiia bacterium]
MTGSATSSDSVAAFLAVRDAVVRRPVGDGGWGTCHALSDSLDEAIGSLVEDGAGADFSVVAVGGYGRREQCIFSDVDLMILHDGADSEALARQVFYPLWDAGLKVGHSVRTVKECLAGAREDFPILTSLLSARVVAGQSGLVDELNREIASFLEGRPLAQRLAAAERERILLEPYPEIATDLKEGRGGLRTFQALWWLRRRRELVGLGEALPETNQERRARSALLRARNALHAASGRPHDRFSVELRGPAAAWLGDEVIDLAGSVTGALRTGDRLASVHLPDTHAQPRRRWFSLGRGPRPGPPPSRPLAAAALVAGRDSGLAEPTEVEAMGKPHGAWTDADRQSLVTILRSGHSGRAAFDSLLEAGWIEAEFPEYVPLVAAPQLAPFHDHPVDVHLWRAVDEVLRSVDDDGWLGRIAAELTNPDELVLAAFLHDIGKCRSGDHSIIGATLAREFLDRAGFPEATAERVSRVVRHHLLLADTATRSDLSDPDIVARLAEEVVDMETLRLLYLVSVADARATGPSVWSPWKASLLRSLFIRVAGTLDPDEGPNRLDDLADTAGIDAEALRGHISAMGAGYVEAHTDDQIATHIETLAELGDKPVVLAVAGSAATVIAPDHTGFLGEISGVFAIHNVSIHEAQLWTRPDGLALDSFHVSDARTGEPVESTRWEVVTRDLVAATTDDIDLDDLVAQKRKDYRRTIARLPVEVASPPDPSTRSTTIEVRCADQPGALFTIVGALYRAGLDIQVARIETIGNAVRDTFYVRDRSGAPIRDVARLAQLVAAIRADLRSRL